MLDAPPDRSPPGARHLDWLEALRGIAVLGVVLVHAGVAIDASGFVDALSFLGQRGVQLFYILSAFTIALSLDSRAQVGERSLRGFFVRRIFRIAPLFYVAIAVHQVERFATTGALASSPRDIALGLVFLHGLSPVAINTVAIGGWSIAVEFMFYALAPALRRLTPTLRATVFVTLAAIVVLGGGSWWLATTWPAHREYLTFLWFPVELPVFLIGICAYRLRCAYAPDPTRDRDRSRRLLLIGAVLIAASLRTRNETLYLSSLGIAAVVLGVSIHPWRPIVNRVTRYLGRISFSIYLMHFFCLPPVKVTLVWLSARGWPVVDSFPALLLSFASTLALAVPLSGLTYRLIEQPGIRLGHRLLARRGSGSRTRSIASAASAITAAAKAIVQIGSVGKKARMIEPMTVATSSCGTTTKTLNSPM